MASSALLISSSIGSIHGMMDSLAVAAAAHAFQDRRLPLVLQAEGSPKAARSTPKKNATKNGFRKGRPIDTY